MSDDLETLTRLIRGRRTGKPAIMDPDREVPRALLEQLLANATWAPSHGLTEPWRFHVFTGKSRNRLAAGMPLLYDQVTPPAEVRPDKREKLGAQPLMAPVLIALGMMHQPGGKIPEAEDLMAVACAVQNLHLSAHAAGLAGFWSSPPLLSAPEAGPVLGMADGEKCLGLFYLGWPRPGSPAPHSARRPLAEKVTWED